MNTITKKEELQTKSADNFKDFSVSSNSNFYIKDTKSDDANSEFLDENKSTNSIERIKKNLAKKVNSLNDENSDFQESKLFIFS